jgi:hypothetical protein
VGLHWELESILRCCHLGLLFVPISINTPHYFARYWR